LDGPTRRSSQAIRRSAVVAVALLASAWTAAGGAAAADGKVTAPPRGFVYWGVFTPGTPHLLGPLIAAEQRAGRRPAIALWYQAWAGRPAFPAAAAGRLARIGLVPMITWEPWRAPRVAGTLAVHQSRYRLSRIAAGAFDDYLRRYALAVRRYARPVMLRPFHEMDGDWYPWGGTVNGNRPAEFVAAWRHIHDVFTRVGADNVTWVWSVNAGSVPNRSGNQPKDYWPGGRYVDWIGISGFNWGAARNFGGWMSFDRIYRSRIGVLLRYHRPIALTEIAAPEVGGDKAAWITATFARLAHYPRVRAVIWYDKRDSKLEDWRIQSSAKARAAFARAVAGRRVRSAPAALDAATTHR
jgi:mannan endo-1,4-beta-mannosidase